MRTESEIREMSIEARLKPDTEFARGYLTALEWILYGGQVVNVPKANAQPPLCDVRELIAKIDYFNSVVRGENESEKHMAFAEVLSQTDKVRANFA